MRVYVGVQPTPSGGASSLSSYIAKSKVDGEREQLTESGARPLFSAHQDRLTLKEADQTLNPTGRELEKEEVIHVVISPEPGSLDRAGDDPAEKYKAVRETIRATVRVIERVLNVKSLLWIAGFHENTKTPHVHVAVSRWALDAVTKKLRFIKHLPKSLLPHNTEDAGGERRFLVGKIAEVFISALVQKLKPIRSVQINPLHGININRSVASRYAQMLSAPTPEQITVGKWLESALMLATGKTGELSRDEVLRQYSELTSEVARIDALAHANGTRPPTAYMAVERLEGLINTKAADVQITVSATPLRAEDEKHVSVAAQQTQVAAASPETKPEPLREDEKFARVDQQSQKQIALRQPEKLVNNREGKQESHERRQDVQSQIPKTQEAVKPGVKNEEPPPVGKFTLMELRNYIQQGNVVLPKPEPLSPAIAQIRPVAITKTDNDDAKVSTPVPIQSTRPVSHAIAGTPAEQTNETTDHSHNHDIPESDEWQIDDHEVTKLTGISFHHLTRVLRDRGMDNSDLGSVLLENSHYFSPNVTRTEAQLREAQINFKICLDACIERKLTPDLEGVSNYLKGELRKYRGSQEPLMEQMNIVRDRLEDLTSPTNRHLFQEFERLHDLYPDIRPTVGYHDLFETRERSHEQTERTRELERDEHER
ncbi:MAG: hypothetical protein QOF72_2991 [Blastocatellia bacterium]|nr:hypothetical protein [Blastocatellia bacterium]